MLVAMVTSTDKRDWISKSRVNRWRWEE